MSEQHLSRSISRASASGSLEPGYTAKDLALCSTAEARALLPFEDAVRLKVLPIAVIRAPSGAKLHCAVPDPSRECEQAIRFVTGCAVHLTHVPDPLLEDAVLRSYLGAEETLVSRLASVSKPGPMPVQKSDTALAAKGDAAQFLQSILEFAVVRSASDLHLCPLNESARIRLRIDGELLTQEQHQYPKWLHEQMISRLKVLARLDTAKRTTPQDGAFTFIVGGTTRCARISTLPTVNGESAVVRLLYARKVQSLATLDIAPPLHEILLEALKLDHGAILLTGPTGSGKTTTLYAAMLHLEQRGRNVVSVEDPVELPVAGVTQVQVNEATGLDYPTAIRSVLRHDPDALLIGEIRDPVSAKIAFEAAQSGHLTLSSVHAGSALQVLSRLSGLGLPREKVIESVSLIVNQRLLPRLCRCKVPDIEGGSHFREPVWKRVGCQRCDYSGYDGRVVLAECLTLLDRSSKEVAAETEDSEVLANLCLPWTVSLQHHLRSGAISVAQFTAFLDDEMRTG